MTDDDKLRKIDIKDCTYYYFDDIVNINNLDLKTIKLE